MQASLLRDRITEFFPNVVRRGMLHIGSGGLIPKEVFLEALEAFNAQLAALNTHMTFLCVGGGMLMFALNARATTEDLDVVLGPNSPGGLGLFHEIAESVAEQFRESGKFPLQPNWVNAQVGPILSQQGYKASWFEKQPGIGWSHLDVLFATPGFMLSMKVQALRPGKKDFGDLVSLIRKLGIHTIDEFEAEVDKYGPGWSFVGNKEMTDLKLVLAWAFPGATPYEDIRQRALEQYKKVKSGK